MSLKPGSRVGEYEILAPPGAGGMGEVYMSAPRVNRSPGRHATCRRVGSPGPLVADCTRMRPLPYLENRQNRRSAICWVAFARSLPFILIVFASVFGGALLGMFLQSVLPPHHLNDKSKDVVKLGMALVASMSALVLSLLISSAKNSYDAQSNELKELSSNIILLDRTLAHYGPETKERGKRIRRSFGKPS
jgi:hypothetical protein